MQGLRDQLIAAWEKFEYFEWRFEADSPDQPKPIERFVEWNGCSLLTGAVHSSDQAFRNSTHVLS